MQAGGRGRALPARGLIERDPLGAFTLAGLNPPNSRTAVSAYAEDLS